MKFAIYRRKYELLRNIGIFTQNLTLVPSFTKFISGKTWECIIGDIFIFLLNLEKHLWLLNLFWTNKVLYIKRLKDFEKMPEVHEYLQPGCRVCFEAFHKHIRTPTCINYFLLNISIMFYFLLSHFPVHNHQCMFRYVGEGYIVFLDLH